MTDLPAQTPSLFQLWQAHPSRITPQTLATLQQQLILPPVDGDPDFWLDLRPEGAFPPNVYESIALLAACAGSARGMRILAAALNRISGEDWIGFPGAARMRSEEWSRIAALIEQGPVTLDDSDYPALAQITGAFYKKGMELPRKLQLLPGQAATIPVIRQVAPPPPGVCLIPPPSGPTVQILDRLPQERLAQLPGLAQLAQPIPLALAPSPIKLREALEKEFPWMAPVIDRVLKDVLLNHFASTGSSVLKLTPLLLVGAPGTGKTRFCQRLGELCGVASETMSLAGVGDARLLMGTAAGWANSAPSFPLALIERSRIGNPLIILDEIEKAHRGNIAGNGGDVIAGLLTFLEGESAKRHLESAISCRANLSYVNWLATANELAPLPAPLRSRFTVIEVPNPGPEHFDQLVDGILKELQAPPLNEAAAEWLWDRFCKGGVSVRALKRAIVGAQQVPQTQAIRLH